MRIKAWLLTILIQAAQLVKLLTSKIFVIIITAVLIYSAIQTHFRTEWPSIITFTKWVSTLTNGERFDLYLLFATICGFFITFYIISANRKSESYTKILIQTSDELHKSVQQIQTALNYYDFYCKKIIEAFLMIQDKNQDKDEIVYRVSALAKNKSIFQKHYEECDKSVNVLFSLAIKNSYIYLLENVAKEHDRLTQIAAFLNLESFKCNIHFIKEKETDLNIFESQVKYYDLLVYIAQINIGKECIAKLSGFINGKFIAPIVPTRLLSTAFIIYNCKRIIDDMLLTNEKCVVNEIIRLAKAKVDNEFRPQSVNRSVDKNAV